MRRQMYRPSPWSRNVITSVGCDRLWYNVIKVFSSYQSRTYRPIATFSSRSVWACCSCKLHLPQLYSGRCKAWQRWVQLRVVHEVRKSDEAKLSMWKQGEVIKKSWQQLRSYFLLKHLESVREVFGLSCTIRCCIGLTACYDEIPWRKLSLDSTSARAFNFFRTP